MEVIHAVVEPVMDVGKIEYASKRPKGTLKRMGVGIPISDQQIIGANLQCALTLHQPSFSHG